MADVESGRGGAGAGGGAEVVGDGGGGSGGRIGGGDGGGGHAEAGVLPDAAADAVVGGGGGSGDGQLLGVVGKARVEEGLGCRLGQVEGRAEEGWGGGGSVELPLVQVEKLLGRGLCRLRRGCGGCGCCCCIGC